MLTGGGGETVTLFYSDLQVMDIMRLSPFEWANLHRWDKAALKYYLIVKGYKERQAIKKMEQEAESKKQFRSSLPKQARPKRR